MDSRKRKTSSTKKINNKINIPTGQRDDYTTRYLLDYPYLKKQQLNCYRFNKTTKTRC